MFLFSCLIFCCFGVEIVVEKFENLELNCPKNNYDSPKVTWTKDGNEISKQGKKEFPNFE